MNLIPSLEAVLNIAYVALGLGLVIFFHELGHFAVAKWCNVHVERFSIGFGPILWSRKKGETEYALSLIPFGGYVKMLGQDDMDPSQLSTEEIAQDPRSYSAKAVWQRMLIISAGVVMNIATAVLFYATAFGFGVEVPPAVVGSVQVGMPAWTAGIEAGDTITHIDDREIESYGDITYAIALSNGGVNVEFKRPDGTTRSRSLMPDGDGTRRLIGVGRSQGTKIAIPAKKEKRQPIIAGTAAALADPPFQPGDTIRTIGDVPIETFHQLQQQFSRGRGETLSVRVQRDGADEDDLVTLSVPPSRFRTLGLRMDIGKITGIKDGSPAQNAGLETGDRITRINDRAVGTELNPLQIPDLLASLQGQEVGISITREVEGGQPTLVDVRLVPLDKPGWIERPASNGVALSAPAIGIAFDVIPIVLKVEEGSPAFGEIHERESIKAMKLVLPEGTSDMYGDEEIVIPLDEKDESGKAVMSWAFAFWQMQMAPTRNVVLTISDAGTTRVVTLTPYVAEDSDWYLPTRGLALVGQGKMLKATEVMSAMQMGLRHTRDSIMNIYLTIRNLTAGRLSIKEMRGPIGIATIAYQFAENGLSSLCLFLGFLSVNLAVLNFLPIPVLDGGHMVFLCWEGVTRKRPSERVLVAATYVGMAFILGLMITVIYLDIFEHWKS